MQVDALRVELPPSEPIVPEFKSAFEEAKADVIMQLNAIPGPFPNTFAASF